MLEYKLNNEKTLLNPLEFLSLLQLLLKVKELSIYCIEF